MQASEVGWRVHDRGRAEGYAKAADDVRVVERIEDSRLHVKLSDRRRGRQCKTQPIRTKSNCRVGPQSLTCRQALSAHSRSSGLRASSDSPTLHCKDKSKDKVKPRQGQHARSWSHAVLWLVLHAWTGVLNALCEHTSKLCPPAGSTSSAPL